MPETQIAFLRGINVGTAKRVAMADLRELLISLGYENVKTLLNSGNAVFRGPKAKAAGLEKAFETRFSFSSRITVLTAPELADIADYNPLADAMEDPSRLLVALFWDAKAKALLEEIAKGRWEEERIAVSGKAAYLWLPGGFLKSDLNSIVQKRLKDSITTRNWATITKLRALSADYKTN